MTQVDCTVKATLNCKVIHASIPRKLNRMAIGRAVELCITPGVSQHLVKELNVVTVLDVIMFYFIVYTFMPAPMLHKGVWPTVDHLVHKG